MPLFKNVKDHALFVNGVQFDAGESVVVPEASAVKDAVDQGLLINLDSPEPEKKVLKGQVRIESNEVQSKPHKSHKKKA